MAKLLQLLCLKREQEKPCRREMIIVSDANTFFIETVLKHHGLHKAFNEIFTNPAQFDQNGLLLIQNYPKRNNCCSQCSSNMCKSAIVKKYLDERLFFQLISLKVVTLN